MKLDLKNETLKICYNNDLPFTSIGRKGVYGIEILLVQTLAESFNFTIELIHGDGVYGSKRPDGNWTGIIGMLQRNEVDMCIGGNVMEYNRLNVLQYLFPHYLDRLSFAAPLPQTLVSFDILLKPFYLNVWLCVMATFVMIFILDQRNFFLRIFKINHETGRSEDAQLTFQKTPDVSLVWISLGLLLRQPYRGISSISRPFKIMAIGWILSAMILSIFYSGYLCSLLALPSRSAIDSIQKLADACRSNKITPLTQENTTVADVFAVIIFFVNISQSKLDTFQDTWREIQPMESTEEGIKTLMEQRSKGKKIAVISTRKSLEYFQSIYGKESFYLPPFNGDSSFYTVLVYIPTSPVFPHREEFSKFMLRVHSSGLIKRWTMDVFWAVKFNTDLSGSNTDYNFNADAGSGDSNSDSDNDSDVDGDDGVSEQEGGKDDSIEFQKFSILHLASIFYFYLICLIMIFFVFITEIFTFMTNPL